MKLKLTLFIVVLIICLSTLNVFALNILKTFYINETDKISLKPIVYDLDNNNFTFSFSWPFNASGEWQTTYEDAGTYIVQVNVSDGKNITSSYVKIVVLNKNRPPVINISKECIATEREKFYLNFTAYDPDGDNITIDVSEPIGKDLVWIPKKEDVGLHNITIKVSDGKATVTKQVTIKVIPFNEPPKIEKAIPKINNMTIFETEKINFNVKAIDPEGKKLSYRWFINSKLVSNKKNLTFRTNYSSAGFYKIKLEVSDGEKTTTREWYIIVKNLNRAPILKVQEEIHAIETEKIKLNVNAYDPDGDNVTIIFSKPFNARGEWQTTYDDAGVHYVKIKASDGKNISEKTIKIIIANKNRKPIIDMPSKYTINETQNLEIKINAYDPDKDNITINVKNLPEIAKFEDNKIIINTDYNTVYKPRNKLRKILNFFGIAKERNVYKPLILVCDALSCTKKKIKIIVNNVNRKPLLYVNNLTAEEGSEIKVVVNASDPDGDSLNIKFSKPLSKDGFWKIPYDAAGTYSINVTVSDGLEEITKPFKLEVKNKNRLPILDIPKKIKIKENQTLQQIARARDLDGDIVKILAINLPKDAYFDGKQLIWNPDFNFVKNKTREINIAFKAYDGKDYTLRNLTIIVENTNRKPIIKSYTIKNLGNGRIYFDVDASDPDHDKLRYEWKFSLFSSYKGKRFIKKYTTKGWKKVTLKACDAYNACSIKRLKFLVK